MAKIADISKYNGIVDWDKASKELLFCILRASVGLEKDTKFDRNAAECTRLHIPFHVYHYLKATDEDKAREEARVFHRAATQTAPLFYVVDCEDNGITLLEKQRTGTANDIVTAFVDELKQLAGDSARVAVYIGNHLYTTWNLDYTSFAYVWIPKYGSNSGAPGTRPVYTCDLWQYTSKGNLDGVTGDVDLNLICSDKPNEFFTTREEKNHMVYDVNKVLSVALAETDYLEKANTQQLDGKTENAGNKNYTKYARDLDTIGFFNTKKQGVAWCAVYVCWAFVEAYGAEAAKKLLCLPDDAKANQAAGCSSARNYFKKKGQLHTENPRPGDQIFFWNNAKNSVSHTGLVYAVDGEYVYTVEGNTNSESGVVANGGAVAQKQYELSYDRIAGYGRPDYGVAVVEDTPAEKPEVSEPVTNRRRLVRIVAPSGRVNIRYGDSTRYNRVALVDPGAEYEYVATSANGWHAVRFNDLIAWVSGEFSVIFDD